MKSHSQIPSQNPRVIAQKINRSGVKSLLPEELDYVEANLIAVAGICTAEQARGVFEYFGRDFPVGFECEPVTGEKDALIAKLREETDKRNS